MDDKRLIWIEEAHASCTPRETWRDCHDYESNGCVVQELVAEVYRLRREVDATEDRYNDLLSRIGGTL